MRLFASNIKELQQERIEDPLCGWTDEGGTLHSLNFRKFKVALKPMYRIFSNFAKSCILSCLTKFCNKKKIHRAVDEI